jgi:hypothetical protein
MGKYFYDEKISQVLQEYGSTAAESLGQKIACSRWSAKGIKVL